MLTGFKKVLDVLAARIDVDDAEMINAGVDVIEARFDGDDLLIDLIDSDAGIETYRLIKA